MTYTEYKDLYAKMTKAERNHQDNRKYRDKLVEEELAKLIEKTRQEGIDRLSEFKRMRNEE